MRQTPYYVFDTDEFAKRAAMIRAALDCKGGRRIPLCFSIKANPFLLHRLPAGLDHVEVCSPGELEICIALGVKPECIIYSGVMKEKCDIERAVSYGAGILTCESIRHATLISEVMLECIQEGAYEAEFAETKAHVILRLTSGNQFGMSLDDIEYIISHPDEFKGIAVMGIHYYSGTQKSLRKINKDLEKIKSALTGLKEKYGTIPPFTETTNYVKRIIDLARSKYTSSGGDDSGATVGTLSPKLVMSDSWHVNIEAMGLHYARFPDYDTYQCTWWAAMRRNQIGKPVDAHMGNGAQWNDTAARLGYKVGRSPKPGDVMCFEAGVLGADGYYGHVAVVEQVNSDGSILISQSGTGWMAVVTQTISSAQLKANAGGVSFIH